MTFKAMFRPVVLYLLFCLITGLSCLAFFALTSHFHLALGHDFMVIGDWATDSIWKVTCLSKFLGLFCFVVILNIQSGQE